MLDEDGWTRVVSTTQSPAGAAKALRSVLATDEVIAPRRPMLPETGSSLESMRTRFNKINAIWLETELCKKLEDLLTNTILTTDSIMTNCVVFGTGSFCGDAVHWAYRQDIAYFQLAAFKTAIGTIERVQGQPMSAYAQEPHYNDPDGALLASLNITKLEHPQGFGLLDQQSFVYSPAAEPAVQTQILARIPQIWLHRQFDPWLQEEDEDETTGKVNQFQRTHEHVQLPFNDLKGFPFQNSVIWWKKQDSSADT